MNRFRLVLPLTLVVLGVAFSLPGCGVFSGGGTAAARSLKEDPKVAWLHCQISGRRDGACAWDNINQASEGRPARRSCYGNAPGGSVRLNPRMLRGMRRLTNKGYTFRVTALAGASHSRNSRHYSGLAFDIDTLNGQRISWSHPDWRRFLADCRKLGATETLGPGDRGHSTHLHVAWPRD
ncbi:MAG: hypothetical protein PVJ98_10670 [Akkermansiaceae bacterium]